MGFENAAQFFMSMKSTIAVVENFVEQFSDIYEGSDTSERDILIRCIQQMFRKYYYSSLLPDISLSPAGIVNTLTEREFSKDSVVVPTLKVEYKGKKMKKINMGTVCFRCDDHPFIKDMEYYIRMVGSERFEVNEIGMIPDVEKAAFRKNILIDDRHYMNILCMVAMEANLVKRTEVNGSHIVKPGSAAEEFLKMDARTKLEFVSESAIRLCAKTIVDTLPELKEELSLENIRELLKKPRELNGLMGSALKKFGYNLDKFQYQVDQFAIGNVIDMNDEEIANAYKIITFHMVFDMYFITPFGYYLQLIEPLYADVYDIESEAENLFDSMDNYQAVRMKLFTMADAYDLTPLGKALFTGKRKPKKLFKVPDEVSDEDLYDLVCENEEYFYDSGYEDYDSEYDEGLLNSIESLYKNENEAGNSETPGKKRSKGQKVEKIISDPEFDAKVFAFKVKWFYNKREWHQVEILGSSTLDDLHEFIMENFELEFGHLYSFFMSNKAWDANTEYSHPKGEGHSAKKIRISGLKLEIKQKFMYLYDYGDELRFEVELTGIKDREESVKYPFESKRSKS